MGKSMIKLIFILIPFLSLSSDLVDQIDRFHSISKKFKIYTGKNYSQIKDIAARRFINLPDWEKHLADNYNIDPSLVYKPQPNIWNEWQNTAYSKVKKAIDSKKKLSFKTVTSWHKKTVAGDKDKNLVGGSLKQTSNFGANYLREWALSPQEIENIKSFVFGDKKTHLKWTELICKEDLPIKNGKLQNLNLIKNNSDCHDIFEEAKKWSSTDEMWNSAYVDIKNNDLFLEDSRYAKWFWYACWPRPEQYKASKNERLCGMITYPEPQEVESLLKLLIKRINQYVNHSKKRDKKYRHQYIENDLKFAISVQREFAAIHPFQDGNGRISRFLMDYVTSKMKLPYLFIPDMNNDYSSNLKQHFIWVKNSIETTNNIISSCLDLYKKKINNIQNSRCGFLKKLD